MPAPLWRSVHSLDSPESLAADAVGGTNASVGYVFTAAVTVNRCGIPQCRCRLCGLNSAIETATKDAQRVAEVSEILARRRSRRSTRHHTPESPSRDRHAGGAHARTGVRRIGCRRIRDRDICVRKSEQRGFRHTTENYCCVFGSSSMLLEGDDPRPGGALKIKRARHGWYTHQTRRSGDDPHAQIIDCRRTSSREHRAPAQREPRTPRTDDSHTTEILATYRPLPRPSGFCHAVQLPCAAEGRPLTERALISEASIFSVRMRPSLSNSGHPSSSSSLRETRSTQSSSPMRSRQRDPLMHSCERKSVSRDNGLLPPRA